MRTRRHAGRQVGRLVRECGRTWGGRRSTATGGRDEQDKDARLYEGRRVKQKCSRASVRYCSEGATSDIWNQL